MFTRETLLVMGHSHVMCIADALKTRKQQRNVKVLNLRNFEKPGKSRDVILADLKTAVGRFSPRAVCLCLGGNSHNVFGLIENPIPFSVGEAVHGSIPAPSEHRAMIPHALMKDVLRARTRSAMASLLYAMFPKAQRLYLNPPPPLGDFDHIRKHPNKFRSKLSLGPTPRALSLYLYQLQSEILKDLAAAEGATFVTPEASLMTPEGCLAPAYFNTDPTHGNAAYGAIMLDKILDRMRTPA